MTDKKPYPMMQRDTGHAKPMYRKGRPGEKDKPSERANEAIPSFRTGAHQQPTATRLLIAPMI